MKLQKCWLSSNILSSLLAVLLAQAVAKEAGSTAIDTEAGVRLGLDADIFKDADSNTGDRRKFGAEPARLFKMFANSVYKDQSAVFRELISNAIDAIEKQHDLMLAKSSETGQLDDISNYKVTVEIDKDNGLISFTDSGVGMTREELENFLGTIAKSGTAEFLHSEKGKAADPSALIGQFGVGFYSVLLIADKVAVFSKNDRDPDQWVWETDSSATFRINKDPKGNTLGRGTRVLLKVKPDSKAYLDHDKVEKIMREYFGHDRHRVYIVKPKTITEEIPDEEAIKKEAEEKAKKESEKKETEGNDNVEVGEEEKKTEEKEKKPLTKKVSKTVYEEVLISQSNKPVWKRTPSSVKPEEYEALYKVLGNGSGKPIAYKHFTSETGDGKTFSAVLFIPESAPFKPLYQNENKLDLKLHVRGVFVTSKFDDFIPKHLSFIKGIIDSDDLSLNISREVLQSSSELRAVRKKIIKSIIEMMSDLASEGGEKFKKFYDSYSSFIKLEIGENEDYRSLLSKILRYNSTKGEMRSLAQYVEDMPEAQKDRKVIYYLAGVAGEVEKSPFIGRFNDKGYEVLLMTEPVDEHVVQKLDKYEDFKFENIAKDGVKIDDEEDKEIKELDEKYKKAKEWIEKALKTQVEKVVLVPGPANVPGSMKSSQWGWTGNMERLITAQTSSKEDPMLNFFAKQKKILELNPKNTLVQEILERANADKADKELKSVLRVMTDAMMIWSGYSVRDTSSFANGIDRMTRKILGLEVEPLKSEAEAKTDEEDEMSLHNVKSSELGSEEIEEAAANDTDHGKDEL